MIDLSLCVYCFIVAGQGEGECSQADSTFAALSGNPSDQCTVPSVRAIVKAYPCRGLS